MKLSIKAKIWCTVSSVVILFAYFIYFYFPNQQKKQVLTSFEKETQGLTNTVALGVQIALDEKNFQGVEMAMNYIKEDPNLVFVSIVQVSNRSKGDSTFQVYTVFKTFPEGYTLNLPIVLSEEIMVKDASFESELLTGKIILGLSTKEVKKRYTDFRLQALVITIIVLIIGVFIGYLLARNISEALNLIKYYSRKVAQGNLKLQLNMDRDDEIGDLSRAFDQMVVSLAEIDLKLKLSKRSLIAKSELIHHKNVQINESIRYAQIIQSAILPNKVAFSNTFKDSFISYKPKDVVSGDFYYYDEVDGKHVFGVFDCTGHGVPGGFMSVMGCVALEHIINNPEVHEPAKALQLLDECIIHSLKQRERGSIIKDGMDGSLCFFDLKNNSLSFCGAHNSLYILRDHEWIILKAERRPIGGGEDTKKQFENHTIDIMEGDSIYMMSDGFVDQFGEKSHKKYMIRTFREFIVSIDHLSMKEQQLEIEREFLDWKGSEDQIDDVLISGIRIVYT